MTTDAWTAGATLAIAIATGVNVLLFIWATRRANKTDARIQHLLGSLDSHSTLQLAFAAKAAGSKVIAWERAKKPMPKAQVHGQEFKTDEIYIVF